MPLRPSSKAKPSSITSRKVLPVSGAGQSRGGARSEILNKISIKSNEIVGPGKARRQDTSGTSVKPRKPRLRGDSIAINSRAAKSEDGFINVEPQLTNIASIGTVKTQARELFSTLPLGRELQSKYWRARDHREIRSIVSRSTRTWSPLATVSEGEAQHVTGNTADSGKVDRGMATFTYYLAHRFANLFKVSSDDQIPRILLKSAELDNL